ncbi:MAG: FHA domain-containing protein [Thermoleophilia bacterium]|nr:FHA domain-containing protein [Thermoleophilia bacterium]
MTEEGKYCGKCGASLFEEEGNKEATIRYSPEAEEREAAELAGLGEVLKKGAYLVVRSGGGMAGETLMPVDGRTSIGRHQDSDIFLDDITVSRHHAIIEHRKDGYYIKDRGSLNGTYVNRVRVETQKLSDGDQLQIGKYKLTFVER